MKEKPSDQYSEQETQQRFEVALRGARTVGHKSKNVPTKRAKRKRTLRRKPDR